MCEGKCDRLARRPDASHSHAKSCFSLKFGPIQPKTASHAAHTDKLSGHTGRRLLFRLDLRRTSTGRAGRDAWAARWRRRHFVGAGLWDLQTQTVPGAAASSVLSAEAPRRAARIRAMTLANA